MDGKTLWYIGKRLLLAAATVLAVITLTFFAARAVPGNPFLREGKALSPQAQAALEEKYGLDKPLGQQYLIYLKNIVTDFDFGTSLEQEERPVTAIIADGLQHSARLGLIAALVAVGVGILLGAVAALNRGGVWDRLIMVTTTAFVSMPAFVTGSVLLLFLSERWGWFPAHGETWQGQVLPVITLALYPLATIARLTRSSMLDVLGQDYIRTARAKGVSGPKILFGHALKNALLPVITYLGPMLAYIITGSLVVERIFNLKGIGVEFVSSITARDYPLIMGTTTVLAMLVVLMTLLSDILYRVIDPRITLK